MVWTAGKGEFIDFLFLFSASITGYLVTAFLLSKFVPQTYPDFDVSKEKKPESMYGANIVIGLGMFTIFCAVMSHQVLHLPAMWGMMFGLSLLKLFQYNLKIKYDSSLNIFKAMKTILCCFSLVFSGCRGTLFYRLVKFSCSGI